MGYGSNQDNFPIGQDAFETLTTSDQISHVPINRLQDRLTSVQQYVTDYDKCGIVMASGPSGTYDFVTPFPSGGGAWPSGSSCPSGTEPFYGEVSLQLTSQRSSGGTYYPVHHTDARLAGFDWVLLDWAGNVTGAVNGTVRIHFRAHQTQER
jgi:hypothetical protein